MSMRRRYTLTTGHQLTNGTIDEIKAAPPDSYSPYALDSMLTEKRPTFYSKGSRGGVWWRPLHGPEGFAHGAFSDGNEPKDVLVVEDEAYLCDLIADVLEAEGHVTRKAANGREALLLIQARRPEIILLDLMMPVMDGWEFMNALKSRPEWGDIPVIVVTAIYDAKRTQDETGARAVLTKPFDIDQLAELVRLYAS